ncbi:MAG TPA: heavy metal translocating P-type ATPase metal-binding domain-containing protein [Flavobacteriales bacterium]|nr:heavy metal translocating P-type ATPase metal-binding domain-containing protein [Flavobacteriales bacterium]
MKFTEEPSKKVNDVTCYHCGDQCRHKTIFFDGKEFCCDGCRMVYDLLKESNLCTYYAMQATPGVSQTKSTINGRFDFLNETEVSQKLIRFTDHDTAHVTFFAPGIHCSSCIWLLENLHRVNPNVTSSTVNFMRKEVTVIYKMHKLSLSQVAELLAHIGYEPLISLDDLEKKVRKGNNRKEIIRIGLAGFCFGNIMMLSFPEYFSAGNFWDQKNLSSFFSYLNLTLSVPVFFYCASPFFISAWKSIRQQHLNIDAPIALAILVTFTRSVYEIVSQTGAGYMDSMSGIVFFMLLGRFFQHKTYETLSFERDYKSYFPIGVSVKLPDGTETNKQATSLKKGDRILIRNQELIPADSVLQTEYTHIDYSFITGESAPVRKLKGELIYAGGRQLDGTIELEVVNPVMQSYLTRAWNDAAETKKEKSSATYIDTINRYFTMVVFSIATISVTYWYIIDPSRALNALTAVLIVACPCGLLLTSTFAHGNVIRIFGRNKFYLKNAGVINSLALADTILFDKTGTITHGSEVIFIGPELSEYNSRLAASLASNSSHPLSRTIALSYGTGRNLPVTKFKQVTGYGIKGVVDDHQVILGSEYFVTGRYSKANMVGKVFLSIDGKVHGFFGFSNAFRPGLKKLFSQLSKTHTLKLVSGDNDSEKEKLREFVGPKTDLLFNLKPEDKFNHVVLLQNIGKKVIMVGDGLNDALALKQSDVGIAVSDDTNTFSPACDVIADGSVIERIPQFIRLARACNQVIKATFIVSLIYNIVGLYFAVSGTLSPVIAAVLMPLSSITIVLMVTILTSVAARKNAL